MRQPIIKDTYVSYDIKLQSLKLRLLRITLYTIQQTSEIMHNLCPNPKNYIGQAFQSHFEIPSNIEPSKYTEL